MRPHHRNRARGELLLQAFGVCRQAPAPLYRTAGVDSPGNASQRSHFVRQRWTEGPFHQPQHVFLGHSGAGRSQTRDLCLAGCAGQLHHGSRLRVERSQQVRTILASRSADDWEGNCALPLRVLARVPYGGWDRVAEGHHGARLVAVRREQDVEIARQHRARGNHSRRARRRCPTLFPAARSGVRLRWLVLVRRPGAALQL